VTTSLSVRAFLALVPPPAVCEQIGMVQKRLKQQWRSGVRWVNPLDVHLTLKFFGAISEREIADVRATMDKISARTAPLALAVRRLGVFPGANQPRVTWLGLHGDIAPLTRLQRDIDERLAGRGFAIEKRLFRPHLTVARLKTPAVLAGLAEIVVRGDEFAAGSFAVRDVTLMKSELTPRGAVYTVLARFPLRADRAL
jgi:2'-5' RNA ligase